MIIIIDVEIELMESSEARKPENRGLHSMTIEGEHTSGAESFEKTNELRKKSNDHFVDIPIQTNIPPAKDRVDCLQFCGGCLFPCFDQDSSHDRGDNDAEKKGGTMTQPAIVWRTNRLCLCSWITICVLIIATIYYITVAMSYSELVACTSADAPCGFEVRHFSVLELCNPSIPLKGEVLIKLPESPGITVGQVKDASLSNIVDKEGSNNGQAKDELVTLNLGVQFLYNAMDATTVSSSSTLTGMGLSNDIQAIIDGDINVKDENKLAGLLGKLANREELAISFAFTLPIT